MENGNDGQDSHNTCKHITHVIQYYVMIKMYTSAGCLTTLESVYNVIACKESM